MASLVYNIAKKEIMDGTLNLNTDTLKIMLINATYTPNADHTLVDAGGASDVLDAEINATNYAGGWGGAGRKTLTTKTFQQDDVNDRGELHADNVSWTALGGAANDTIVAAVLVKEGGANDTTSRLIAYIDLADTTTNGGDFTIQWNAEGLLQHT